MCHFSPQHHGVGEETSIYIYIYIHTHIDMSTERAEISTTYFILHPHKNFHLFLQGSRGRTPYDKFVENELKYILYGVENIFTLR